jgi:asparagine synthase (glutamine-hydrolysing)
MCGIAALIEPGRRFDPALLAAMGDDLRHRGPDSEGVVNEPGVGLVFRRLSILDPAPRADQPMTDPSGQVTLIFNGEIYNFRALRDELQAKGASFRTTGDTEVILQGYLAWGAAVLDRLEGMYALVLVDRRSREVLAARDPFGIKPLYLLRKGALTALASEMRPLTRIVAPEPDPQALAELLTFGWAAGGLSNLKGIERVPGGTLLRVSLADGAVRRQRFCDPLDTFGEETPVSADEAAERAHDALKASIEAHLASDVGYTVQLSGGVDSSLITAIAAGRTDGRLVTFGIKLDDERHDESPWRRQVIERYGVDHREVALGARDFADALPRAIRHMEGPSPHLGCVMLMLLCDRIREVSKVVLTGEGGDEFFGGYERYGRWRRLRAQERWSRVLPTALLPKRPPFLGIRRLSGRDAAIHASVYHDFPAMHRMFPALVPGPGLREQVSRRFRDFRDRLLAVDQSAYLESLLVRQDKMAMAASVEARVPFVHLPLARVLNRLPRALRVPGGVTKPILKALGERYLPHDLLHRRKVGLTLPYRDWLRQDNGLGRYLDDLTAPDSRLGGYTDRGRLRDAVGRFRTGCSAAGDPDLVRLINVETWLRSLAAPAGARDLRAA